MKTLLEGMVSEISHRKRSNLTRVRVAVPENVAQEWSKVVSRVSHKTGLRKWQAGALAVHALDNQNAFAPGSLKAIGL